MWDADDNEYIDYHAAFAPYILGHNDPGVNDAVIESLQQESSLYGSGTTIAEGELAELVCESVPFVEAVQFLNTGSEATYQAIRLARAYTGRDHLIVMQGGYNGWHNDVSCNLSTPLSQLGPRRIGEEYPFHSLSAGIPGAHQQLVHPVNFNDLESVRVIAERYPIAALITEPILQNIGVVHPLPGYLEGLRELAQKLGFILIFDEVKTGFRHGLGGYSSVCGVTPDLAVYGKAIANGYPIAAIGGRRDLLDLFYHPDPALRVLLAGTYNGHPVPVAAALATIRRLAADDGALYATLDRRGNWMAAELAAECTRSGVEATAAREGSAFCVYFMDHAPRDWHDLAEHHDFTADELLRQGLIERGVYVFPLATKQWSISAAHSEADLEQTVEAFRPALDAVLTAQMRR